ncbi:hypothetical protein niasHT_004623 [Heterodera trifolii]|uniref:Uncharacterized protein n=1 Tax=Heterodera trifolii TaxID=157864 RepID=A0ABD2M7F5_9BILA
MNRSESMQQKGSERTERTEHSPPATRQQPLLPSPPPLRPPGDYRMPCVVIALSLSYLSLLNTVFPLLTQKKCHDHLISANDGCSRTVWRSDVSTALPSPSHHHQIIIHSHQQNWETMTRQITGEEQQLTSPGGGRERGPLFVSSMPNPGANSATTTTAVPSSPILFKNDRGACLALSLSNWDAQQQPLGVYPPMGNEWKTPQGLALINSSADLLIILSSGPLPAAVPSPMANDHDPGKISQKDSRKS